MGETLERSRKSRIGRSNTGGERTSGAGASDGFTLIEVLVALTILGMSLAVLLAIFSQALMREHGRDQALAARTLASALIAQAVAVPSVATGETRGQAAPNLSWRLRIEPYGRTADTSSTEASPVRVSATVVWPGGSQPQALTLTTLRLTSKEAQE